MNLLHYSAAYTLHLAWAAVRAGRPDTALKTYEAVIGTALPGSLELRVALLGAGFLHYGNGEPEQAAIYAREFSSSLPTKRVHPKDRQIYIPVEDLLRLPYLRKHELWCSSPGRFNPEKRHMGHQAIIAATTWEKRPHFYGRGHSWVASVYWLKDYDPPLSYDVYTGGDSRPCEAVTPIEVLAAIAPVREMQQCKGGTR